MAVHGNSTPIGRSVPGNHCTLQSAVLGGKTAVPVGVCVTSRVFGSEIVALMVE